MTSRWRRALGTVAATTAERQASRPGDDVAPDANVVMDRAFTVGAPAEDVWPWIQQLGKWRAGWYLPASVERFVPRGRRASRTIDGRWQHLRVGDVVPDYGGKNATFEVRQVEANDHVVYWSRRGHITLTWSVSLHSVGVAGEETRVVLRLRLAGVRRAWLARSGGDLIDLLTIAAMAAGLRERLTNSGC